MRLAKVQSLRAVFGLLTLAIISSAVQALGATEGIRWNFGNGMDGAAPEAGPILDKRGNLYGTTATGGADVGPSGGGTVFELTPNGDESILWNFGNGADGAFPAGGLITDKLGNLYGTTAVGGAYDRGTVFKLTPPSTDGENWTESILWNFNSNGTDGYNPRAGVIMDTRGNLYGTTQLGGAEAGSSSGGTVFKLTPPATIGGNWTESILWNFGGYSTDGAEPETSLITDEEGNLYGTTTGGGAYKAFLPPFFDGTVFKLTPPATIGGNWTESILWNFGNGSDGNTPFAGLIKDKSGNLYGTTYFGGAQGAYGYGTVFELMPPSSSGGNWTESILWNFDGNDGSNPLAGLLMDPSGNLYGTAENDGTYFGGTAFELTPPSTSQGSWNEAILWSFGDGTDGKFPGGLIMNTGGKLFGTTSGGGVYDVISAEGSDAGGTVFEISKGQPQILLQATKIVFPATALGSTSTAKLMVQNIGAAQLIGTVNIPPAPFGIRGPSSFSLAPTAGTTITLTFTPAALRPSSKIDNVVSNAVKHPVADLELQGTGTAPSP